MLKNSRFFRRALTQAVKRSPVPLQPVIGVKKETDAYTLGHALVAAARLSGAPAAGAAQTAARASAPRRRPTPPRSNAGRAMSSPSSRTCAPSPIESGSRIAWGYHFAVHTRFFSYVPPTPNLIVTAFVSKGLAAVTRAGLADCSAELRGAVAFILEGLPSVTDDTGQCIGYVPGEKAVVHNANMLAALVLCEAAELLPEAAAAGALARRGARVRAVHRRAPVRRRFLALLRGVVRPLGRRISHRLRARRAWPA